MRHSTFLALLFLSYLTSVRAQTIDALPDMVWEKSMWISVKDAPIVTLPGESTSQEYKAGTYTMRVRMN